MNKKAKKTYRKPQVTRVKLMTEEAVLGACKATTASPSGVDVCHNPVVPGCYSAGS